MKTRILASIITGFLIASAAQAETAFFSANDLDSIYSGINPSFTRNVDVSGYYTVPAQLAEQKSMCRWRVVQGDINAPRAAFTMLGNQDYFAPVNVQLVC